MLELDTMTGRLQATEHSKRPLAPKVAERLLDLLSTDDDFRGFFAANPTAALLTLGHEQRGAACRPLEALAPKATFVAARDELLAHIMSTAMFMDPHCFQGTGQPDDYLLARAQSSMRANATACVPRR